MLTYLAIGLALQLLSSFWSICVRKSLADVDFSDFDLGMWAMLILRCIIAVALVMIAWPVILLMWGYILIKQKKES